MGWKIVVASVVLFLIASCGRNETAPTPPPRPEIPASSFAGVGFLDSGDSICTGTLLAPKLVLTAGHCVHERPLRDLHFTLNAAPLKDSSPAYADATEVLLHPQYHEQEDTPGVDIALIRLGSLDYGAVPATYPVLGNERELRAGAALVNVGYGENADGTHALKRVKQVTLTELAELPLREGVLPRGLVLVARGVRGEIGCAGDSGSPLFLETAADRAILGVYSTSESHDDKHYPERLDCRRGIAVGNYIATSAFSTWVRSKLGP